jgi:predicted permease
VWSRHLGSFLNDTVPLDHDSFVLAQFTIDGQPDPGPGRHPVLNRQMISPNYFRTLEIPLLKGRDFNEQDKADRQPVVIVDDGLADHFFPGQDPIGQAINFEYSRGVRRCTIVGVVSHVRDRSPGYQENRFQAYFPYSQWNYDTEILLVRCEGDPHAQITSIRNVVQAVDPDVPVPNIKLFDDLISQNLVTRKLGTLIVSLFAGAALFLSVIGLYGALSYSTSQRRREIGVRIALGAESLRILHMVAEQGFKLIVIGLIAGIVPALVCAHLIESVLYGVTPIDPISMLTAIVVLFLAGCLACVLPALRAVRTDPVKVLRE